MKTKVKTLKVRILYQDGTYHDCIHEIQNEDGELKFNYLATRAKHDEILEAPVQLLKEMVLSRKELKGQLGRARTDLQQARHQRDEEKRRLAEQVEHQRRALEYNLQELERKNEELELQLQTIEVQKAELAELRAQLDDQEGKLFMKQQAIDYLKNDILSKGELNASLKDKLARYQDDQKTKITLIESMGQMLADQSERHNQMSARLLELETECNAYRLRANELEGILKSYREEEDV